MLAHLGARLYSQASVDENSVATRSIGPGYECF